jgi:AcrR family transcriptional regulator
MAGTVDMDGEANGKSPGRARLSAAERRETILRAAAEVFAQAGYRAGKVSDVAARVGVTEPVVFQNFGSKAALFAAVVEHAAAEIRTALDDLTSRPGSSSKLLEHVLSRFAHGQTGQAAADPGALNKGADHPGPAYGVLFADAIALTAEPELAEPARNALRAIVAHLADLIQRAQAEGGIRQDADPEAAAWLLLSVLSSRRLRAAAMSAGLEPAITALALRSLAPPGPSSTARG